MLSERENRRSLSVASLKQVVALALSCLLVATGCQGAEDSGAESSEVGSARSDVPTADDNPLRPPVMGTLVDPSRPSEVGGDETLPTPVESFDWFTDEAARLDDVVRDAVDARVGACMEAQGFEYRVLRPATPVGSDVSRYGVANEATAREHGYLPVLPDGPLVPDELGPELTGAAQEAYMTALVGDDVTYVNIEGIEPDSMQLQTPVGSGCETQARVEVLGSVDNYVEYEKSRLWMQALVAESFSELVVSQEWSDLAAAWRACMAEAGFSTESDPLLISAQPWPEPRPSAIEVSTALADVSCKRATRFTMEADELLRRSQQLQIRQHEESVLNSREFLEAISQLVVDI